MVTIIIFENCSKQPYETLTLISFNSEKYTDKMAKYHQTIPKLIFEIFYTKLGWSSKLRDTQEK